MKWWREARFGMFIHWGVYSVPAGTYNGKQIGGIGEWIMNRGKIPVAEYRNYAKQFNPVKFNADEWVKLAKDAGMKYIVITCKHHDGFAMFDSQGQRLEHRRRHAVQARSAQGTGRRLPEARASSSASTIRRRRTGTIPAARRCGRTLGPGAGRQHGRLHRQGRRAAGARRSSPTTADRRALVGHADGHEPTSAREKLLPLLKLQPGIITQQPPRRRLSPATPKRPSSSSPPPASRARLGNLHDA